MEPEGFKRFRSSKVQLFSRIKPRNIFPGEWESSYRGSGIEFAEIKPFEPGDDLRDLDLHTLAQSGEEEIIQRVVERQMRILVWLDFSGSMLRSEKAFFAHRAEIRDIATGLLLFSACNTYSPVGLCAFNRARTRYFPPRIGERYCWEILGWLVQEEYEGHRAAGHVQAALSLLLERVSPRSLVFLVSDFEDPIFEGDSTALLRPVAKTFDFVPVVIRDPLETRVSLKRSAILTVDDCEDGSRKDVYLTPQKLGELQAASARHLLSLERNFREVGIEHVVLDSPLVKDCYQILSAFFLGRQRTRG